jgi:tetratricopeptide (TPR) repeat protein
MLRLTIESMKIPCRRTIRILALLIITGFSGFSSAADDPGKLLDKYLETGSPELAERIRKEFPGSPYASCSDAWEYLDANNEMARELAQKLVTEHPDFARGYFVLGSILAIGFRDYSGALDQLDRSLEIDPEFIPCYQNRGLAEIGLQDYGKAKIDFDRVLNSRRGYAEGFLLRGVANYGLGNEEAMKSDFEIGLQLDFKALSAIPANLADEAINKAIEAAPDNAIYYYARGYSRFVSGDYRAAAADFRKCIELVPGSSDFYKYSGASRMHLDDLEGGQKDLNYALSVNPDDPEIYYYLGVLMNDYLKQPAMALEYMNLAINLDGSRGAYFFERSKAAYQMKDYAQARDDINRALRLDRSQGDYYALRGNIKLDSGDPAQDFCPDFKKAVEWGTSQNLKRTLKKYCR